MKKEAKPRALAKTVERKEKNVMSASRWSETVIAFPEESTNPIPWRLPTSKNACRTDSTMRSDSRSTEPVGMAKYAATVVVKSLIVIEGEEEREIIRRKKRIATIVLRYGSALMLGGTIVRIVSSYPIAVSWYFPKRDTELTVLELAVYVDRLLVVVMCIVSMVEVSLKRTAVGAM